MEPQYNSKEIEDKIYKHWEESGYFNPDNLPNKQKESFSVVVPPPNVTGFLHMGHALNATIQDIIVRKKRMEGYKTVWIPGTDHAGIATQNVVEKDLKKQGLNRHDLGREKFLKKVWEWKDKYGNTILNQFKKMGCSMDWSRTRFTMDEGYQKAVNAAFIHYYKKGWLYKAERVINWCVRCQTSLSDLELEYKEEKGKLYWIKYGPFTLATTRPETKLGDTAVAVNPTDERYKDMVGKEYDIPGVLGTFKIKVVADRTVDPNFGSGAVKVTPAHSIVDSEIAERHNIPMKKIINEYGKMMENCGKYAGLKTSEAREKIVEDMEKMGLIEKIEDHTHNVAVCYRCGTMVENLPSPQWFVKMDDLSKPAIKAVKKGEIKFYPASWKKFYLGWMKNLRDWNISRQIWWGHQLPVFYCNKNQEVNSKFSVKSGFASGGQILNSNKKENEKFVVTEEKPKKCPFCGDCEMIRDQDVLDTWFSSALWPFAVFGWPQKVKSMPRTETKFLVRGSKFKVKSDLEKFYPTQVISTARDIIPLWIARMIFSGLELAGKKPFSDVIIHPTILTKDGKRMSKSLGTGIDPMEMIEKYGADATRFGLIWQAMGNQDIHWDETALFAGKKFANKVWNIARFVLGQMENSKPEIISASKNLKSEDKKILSKLKTVEKAVEKNIDKYRFGQALHILYDFIWHEFADKYIELSKNRADAETKKVSYTVLTGILKMLHPFMPFMTEEIWGLLPKDKSRKKFLIIEKW